MIYEDIMKLITIVLKHTLINFSRLKVLPDLASHPEKKYEMPTMQQRNE